MAMNLTDLRSMARSHTQAALKTLVHVMRAKDAPPSARVSAACALLDRGWGKPDQHLSGEITASAAFIELLNRINSGEFSTPIDGKVIEHNPAEPAE